MELNDITNTQDIFNYAVGKLLKQNAKSTDGIRKSYCMYRGKNETKCAVGHLIADEHYDESFEDKNILSDEVKNVLSCSLPNVVGGYPWGLLSQMQRVHDNKPINLWEKSFKELAKEHKLEYNPTEF